MSLLTQKAIFNTFEEMLEEMPFDKITVSSLVKRSGISPNTFYYHYRDINELLRTWLINKFSCCQEDFSENGDWKKGAKKILHTCKSNPKIVYNISKSLSRDYLERSVFESTNDDFSELIRQKTKDTPLSETQIDEIVQFCKLAFVEFFLKFLWNNMEDNIDNAVDSFGQKLENFILVEIESQSKKSSQNNKTENTEKSDR